MEKETQRAGVGPDRVVVEITETGALSENQAAQASIEGLLNAGFRVSLDDFGAGWSTLDQLVATPAQSFKIDRRLVATLPNPRVMTVLRALKTIADELDMLIVAEGVETVEQLEFFQQLGVHAIQGWLFARSEPLDDLQETIKACEATAERYLAPQNSQALAAGTRT